MEVFLYRVKFKSDANSYYTKESINPFAKLWGFLNKHVQFSLKLAFGMKYEVNNLPAI